MSAPLRGADVAAQMRAIEDCVEVKVGDGPLRVDGVIATLLGIEVEGLDDVLDDEMARVVDFVSASYYERDIELTPSSVVALGVLQGVILAAAVRHLKQDGRTS